MNVGTGGGTMRHELIHPLIAADFPEVLAWFNEGFASVFEGAYHARGGVMRGMINWRFLGKSVEELELAFLRWVKRESYVRR